MVEVTYKHIAIIEGIIIVIFFGVILSVIPAMKNIHNEGVGMGYIYSKCEVDYLEENRCELDEEQMDEVRKKYNLEDLNIRDRKSITPEYTFDYDQQTYETWRKKRKTRHLYGGL